MTEGVGGACGCGGGSSTIVSLRGLGSAGRDGGVGRAGLGGAEDASPPAPLQAAGAGPGPSRQL